MSNQSEDIQAADSDTRPPMLDKTDFKSWQQRIRDEIASVTDGSELTKDDRESQLYDEFKHSGQHKGENIHDYHVRFTKLINDMIHIKMTMPKIQLNSKFVNDMFPEWGRFVTAVKLNRGLKESNHDQLYAYLKQHELHTNENKMLMERLNQHTHDPLALVSNVSPYLYPSSSSVPPQPSYIPPGRQNRVQGNNARGAAATGNGGAQYRAGNANVGQGKPIKCYNCNGIRHIARNCIQPKRPQNSDYFKEKMLLMQAQENGVDLDEEQLLFLAGGQINTFDDETMFMANLFSADPVYDEAGPSYDSDTFSEVQDHDNCLDNMNESHEEHEIHNDVQPNDVVESDTEYTSNSNIISVAIGYKNPFYLSKAKQLQPALYNGHEIVKTNHAHALVHDSEDTLEIAGTTRKQMIEKMKDPKCVKKKVKIAPHDYFDSVSSHYTCKAGPQSPPNKKSSTSKYLFSGTTFLEFDKTYKKRITPTGITEGERGFEQTKTCYLTEVIPFFKIIKEHFEGIQKALINEIKEMKEVFDQMEAEVDQNAFDKKCDEIERKNLLIENENLIAECLSKDVFYTTTDSVLTVSRFSDMHDAYNNNFKEGAIQLRELKEKYSCLQKKHSEADPILDFKALDSQNKDLNAKVNALQDLNERFRVENKKVKQHYKELYDSIKLTHAKTIEKTTSLLNEIETLKAQIKGKMNWVTMSDPVKPKVLDPGMYAIDVEQIPPRNRNNREVHLEYLKHLKESVGTLREIVEEARVQKPLDSSLASACLYTKHSQELP
ncbi:hypothetical protein Tco_0086270 [Tanacetum coccineum]